MRKVAIFGGSFDPFHTGHLEIIERLSKSFDTVYVVPTTIRYYKSNQNMFSFQERFSKVCTKVKDFENVQVLDIERDVDFNWRYYNSLLKIISLELKEDIIVTDDIDLNSIKWCLDDKGIELYTAMGSDAYLNFENWFNWEGIIKLTKLIVFNRPEFELKSMPIECEYIRDMNCEQSSTKLREKLMKIMSADEFDDYLYDCGWSIDQDGNPISFE